MSFATSGPVSPGPGRGCLGGSGGDDEPAQGWWEDTRPDFRTDLLYRRPGNANVVSTLDRQTKGRAWVRPLLKPHDGKEFWSC